MSRTTMRVARALLLLLLASCTPQAPVTTPERAASPAREERDAAAPAREPGADAGSDAGVTKPAVAAARPSLADDALVAWRQDSHGFALASGVLVLLVGTPGGATVALAPEPSPPRALAFSPDGALLAAVEEDGVVRLLDAHTGVHVAELLAPDGPKERLLVSDPTLSFSADGTRLVAVTDRARVWNVASRTHVCTVAADWVYDARLSTDGKRLVGSSRTGAFARFDGACVLRAEGSADTGGTFGASLSPDARFLASSEQGHGLKIHVLEPRGERDVQTPVTTCRHHVSPGFSDDGTKLIVLADWFRSYKTSGFSLLAAWTPPAEERESIQATLDDGLHVIEQDGAHAAIVDVRKPSARVPFDAAGATRFRGSPDSAFVLGIAENEARVWLTATGAFAAIVRRP